MDADKPEDVTHTKSTDTWQCKTCSFKNIDLLPLCEMCESPRPSHLSDPDKLVDKADGSGFQCHACKYVNKTLVAECLGCGETLIPEEEEEDEWPQKTVIKKTEATKKLKNCSHCGFENDPENLECVSCEMSLDDIAGLIPTKKRRAPRLLKPKYARHAPIACATCGIATKGHVCMKIPAEELQVLYKSIDQSYCSFCYEKFDFPGKSNIHEKQCAKRKEFFSPESQTFQRTTTLQKDSMVYMHNKSEKYHWLSEKPLLERIKGLGFNAEDLENLHHYLVNYAPIIIHMHANNHMQFFVKDTHYRNQFETKKSSGSLSSSSRTNWEDRMFDGLHHRATPFERVKYGTINFTNDPKGVRACASYGQSYFLLKPHVRNRCTVTDMDSSSPTATIGTFQFCYHVLNKLPDEELKAAFSGSKANEVGSRVIGSYKQIQIHGPVQFKRDIEAVYVNKAELADPKILQMVKQFCTTNELDYEIFQYEPVPSPHVGLFGMPPSLAPSPLGFGAPVPAPYYAPLGFGAPVPASYYAPLAFGAPVPASYYAPPLAMPSTAHLFGGRRRYPAPPMPLPAKEQQQGVDYI